MSDPPRNQSSTAAAGTRHRQPSRLQRRAPSSLQISRPVEWNVAIPLLSPLASSPPPQELKPQDPPKAAPVEKAVAFKSWQHPAAPFCYEQAPVVPPFVPV